MNLLFQHRALLLIPLNVNSNHWTLISADIVHFKMTYYDSLPPADVEMANALFKKLEKLIKAAGPSDGVAQMPELWNKTVSRTMPVQTNNYDCGLFVYSAMRALCLGIDLNFHQSEMMEVREDLRARLIRREQARMATVAKRNHEEIPALYKDIIELEK